MKILEQVSRLFSKQPQSKNIDQKIKEDPFYKNRRTVSNPQLSDVYKLEGQDQSLLDFSKNIVGEWGKVHWEGIKSLSLMTLDDGTQRVADIVIQTSWQDVTVKFEKDNYYHVEFVDSRDGMYIEKNVTFTSLIPLEEAQKIDHEATSLSNGLGITIKAGREMVFAAMEEQKIKDIAHRTSLGAANCMVP